MVSCCHCNIYSCLYLPRSKKNPHLLSFLISCRAFGSGATAEFVRVTEPAMGPVNWFSWLDSGLCRGVFLTRNKRCVLSLLATVWKWDSKFAQEMALFRRKLFPHPVGSKSLTPASPSSSSITLPVLPHGPQSAAAASCLIQLLTPQVFKLRLFRLQPVSKSASPQPANPHSTPHTAASHPASHRVAPPLAQNLPPSGQIRSPLNPQRSPFRGNSSGYQTMPQRKQCSAFGSSTSV